MMDNIKIGVTEARILLETEFGHRTTVQTIIRWCKLHGIGTQLGTPGGSWMVDREKLLQFVREGTYKGDKNGPTS